MTIEALVSIASGAGAEFFTIETQPNMAFLEDTNEINFSNDDMEVKYLDCKRPLYLVASIN